MTRYLEILKAAQEAEDHGFLGLASVLYKDASDEAPKGSPESLRALDYSQTIGLTTYAEWNAKNKGAN